MLDALRKSRPIRRIRAWWRRRGRFRRWKLDSAEKVDPIGWERAEKAILANERGAMARRRRSEGYAAVPPMGPSEREVAALAISGGGIRSATFSLGVLQALAAEGLLSRFDYLSTVSGGGYLGSSLTWMLDQKGLREKVSPEDNPRRIDAPGLDADDFPYGAEDPEPPAGEAPSRRDSPWQQKLLRYLREHGNYLAPGKQITILSGVAVLLRGVTINLFVWLPMVTLALMVLGLVGPLFFSLVWGPFRFWGEATPSVLSAEALLVYLAIGAELAALFAVLSLVYAAFTGLKRLKGRYQLRRWTEQYSSLLLKTIAGLMLVGSVPLVVREIGDQVAETGAASLMLGFVSAAVTYFRSGNGKGAIPVSVIAIAGSFLMLYGLLLLAYELLPWLIAHPGWALLIIPISFFIGWRSNLNYISLHRFYRDRLMETFMPGLERALANETGASTGGDQALLSRLGSRSPYHLINTHVILVDSPRQKLRRRGGDSFLLSPGYAGSDATGYRRMDTFANNSVGLATAMAISGAAANPNTGVGGVGPTRQLGVSLLMSLMSIRLGYWVPHPVWHLQRSRTPSHFRALWYQLSARGYTESSRNLEISDGGHFENLGIYELLRRRCGFVLAIDSGADPSFAFGDLRNAAERIREDLDARLDFEPGELEGLIPKEETRDEIANAPTARWGFARGTIYYGEPGSEDAWEAPIVYVKSTMIKDASLRVRGYRREHPEFPDQSTADQFFDESQFEAYRRLGYEIGMQVAADLRKKPLMPAPWYGDPARRNDEDRSDRADASSSAVPGRSAPE